MLNITLEELLEAGSHFGHQVRRWNPKMAPYIYAQSDGVHIFDLTKTREAILEACEFLTKVVKDGGVILFVGTKRQAKVIVERAAKNSGMPFVTSRWMGGSLTNFEQMKRSVRKLEELKKDMADGKYNDYTKKERLLLDREIAKLERDFGGVISLKQLPQAIFVVDTKEERTAVLEARKLGIPVVGIVDTNSDPTIVNYPIPANDDAVKSIELLVGLAEKAVWEGKEKTDSQISESRITDDQKDKKSGNL